MIFIPKSLMLPLSGRQSSTGHGSAKATCAREFSRCVSTHCRSATGPANAAADPAEKTQHYTEGDLTYHITQCFSSASFLHRSNVRFSSYVNTRTGRSLCVHPCGDNLVAARPAESWPVFVASFHMAKPRLSSSSRLARNADSLVQKIGGSQRKAKGRPCIVQQNQKLKRCAPRRRRCLTHGNMFKRRGNYRRSISFRRACSDAAELGHLHDKSLPQLKLLLPSLPSFIQEQHASKARTRHSM